MFYKTRVGRNGVHGAYGATKAMSEDVKELLARNKAYKVTLEYCNETCNDVDNLFNAAYVHISQAIILTDKQREMVMKELTSLNTQVKEQGTRKLRQAFVDYVLTTGCSKLEHQTKEQGHEQ